MPGGGNVWAGLITGYEKGSIHKSMAAKVGKRSIVGASVVSRLRPNR
jgi:hypothetical protein